MIDCLGPNSALLIVDAQKGINASVHWGGEDGHRNNPDAERKISQLLNAWRNKGRRVYFTFQREQASPLKLSLPTGEPIAGLEPRPGERVILKEVNSGFIGTNLEPVLRHDGTSRLIVAGYFTNMCVESTVRMARNLGFDTYLAQDACAASNRLAPDGQGFDAETVHRMSVVKLHGEYCTALNTADLIGLLNSDAPHLWRAQGNE